MFERTKYDIVNIMVTEQEKVIWSWLSYNLATCQLAMWFLIVRSKTPNGKTKQGRNVLGKHCT